MRQNAHLTIQGQRCKLVPYRPEHVAIYHKWMEDPVLQEATASEPLSLDEEYEMQRSWFEDDKKCTFIVLDRDLPDRPGTGQHGGGMVGDVNLFWNDHDDPNATEIEIMIAESGSRRRGVAQEALTLMMNYAVDTLGVTLFRAKIGEANTPSLRLFEKLKFTTVSRSEYFNEVTMELPASQVPSPGSPLVLGSYDEEST